MKRFICISHQTKKRVKANLTTLPTANYICESAKYLGTFRNRTQWTHPNRPYDSVWLSALTISFFSRCVGAADEADGSDGSCYGLRWLPPKCFAGETPCHRGDGSFFTGIPWSTLEDFSIGSFATTRGRVPSLCGLCDVTAVHSLVPYNWKESGLICLCSRCKCTKTAIIINTDNNKILKHNQTFTMCSNVCVCVCVCFLTPPTFLMIKIRAGHVGHFRHSRVPPGHTWRLSTAKEESYCFSMILVKNHSHGQKR